MASNLPHIRYATEEDVPEILALVRELAIYEKALDSVTATEEMLRSTLSFPSNPSKGFAKTLLLIAPHQDSQSSSTTSSSDLGSREGRVAGMALYFNNYSTWHAAPGIYLEDLFIRPEYRGRGYGTMLLSALADECLKIGGKRLEWWVLKWNEPSINFYKSEKIGAKEMDEWTPMRVEGDEGLKKLADRYK